MKERRRRLPALVLALAAFVLALGLAPRVALAEGEVAQIGGKLYTSLQAAVDNVPADGVNQEIELISDITMTTDDIVTISEGQNITLLLRDHWIIGDSENFSGRPIVNNGTLTVDGREGGGVDTCRSTDGRGSFYNSGTLTILGGTFRGALENRYANIWNAESAKLTVESGTFDTSITAVNSAAGSTLEINGGYFASPWGPTIENNGNATITGGDFVNTSCSSCDKDHWAYTIRSGETNENAYLRIDYATVTGTQGGVSVVGGTADIYDGSFSTTDCSKQHGAVFYALYVAGESYKTSTTVYGGAFSSEKREAIWVGNSNSDGGNQEEATLVIKGGTFNGVNGTGDAVKVDEKLGGLSISGGTFSSDVTDYLDEGVEQGEDGTVAELPDVAQVGDAGYKTLAAAIEAAKNGDTVALLQDLTVDEAITIAQDKDFILDLGNYTLTLTGSTTYHDDATAAAPNHG